MGYDNAGAFATPYTGTGTKKWRGLPITGDGGSGTTTLPTQPVSSTFTNYRLLYQLAQPVQETISTDGLYPVLNAGMNQVELGESIRIKEPVTPSLTGSIYTINAHTNPNDRPKYLVERIIAVYRNGTLDPKWIISPNSPPDGTFGKYFAKINASDFDPTASYSVTYIAQPYAVSSSILSLDGSYESNLRKDVDKNTANIADLGERLTAVELTKANRQAGWDGWITLTPLNAFSHYDATNATGNFGALQARKHDDGTISIRGLVNYTGTPANGTVIAYLPLTYRPRVSKMFIVQNYTSTIVRITIDSSGKIIFDSPVVGTVPAGWWMNLNGIRFEIEQ
jgi:hypothetical protein